MQRLWHSLCVFSAMVCYTETHGNRGAVEGGDVYGQSVRTDSQVTRAELLGTWTAAYSVKREMNRFRRLLVITIKTIPVLPVAHMAREWRRSIARRWAAVAGIPRKAAERWASGVCELGGAICLSGRRNQVKLAGPGGPRWKRMPAVTILWQRRWPVYQGDVPLARGFFKKGGDHGDEATPSLLTGCEKLGTFW